MDTAQREPRASASHAALLPLTAACTPGPIFLHAPSISATPPRWCSVNAASLTQTSTTAPILLTSTGGSSPSKHLPPLFVGSSAPSAESHNRTNRPSRPKANCTSNLPPVDCSTSMIRLETASGMESQRTTMFRGSRFSMALSSSRRGKRILPIVTHAAPPPLAACTLAARCALLASWATSSISSGLEIFMFRSSAKCACKSSGKHLANRCLCDMLNNAGSMSSPGSVAEAHEDQAPLSPSDSRRVTSVAWSLARSTRPRWQTMRLSSKAPLSTVHLIHICPKR
mmetsp:Transcript_136711/g.380984  ORF Transcript_136711/g.380984 Transcript_136711/m.380984 type:complete len:284 (-) Transcript_136711:89-940(-)